jgi:hypothetical protein
MKLYFEEYINDEPKRTYIGESRVESTIDALMYKDMEARGIKYNYLRYMYLENNEKCVDYGSWSKFYIITPNEDKDTEVDCCEMVEENS